jgi:lipoprotein-anchoring transpeptidase ErfK/SrfK
MTHYLSVMQRAVDSLDPNTVEARAALYERARGMLRERYSTARARLELASLDEAIELIEAETLRRSGAADFGLPPRWAERAFVDEAREDEPPYAAEPLPPPDEFFEQTEAERARSRALLRGGPRRRWPFALLALALLAIAVLAAFWLRPAPTPEPVAAAKEERATINYVYLRQPVYYRTTHPAGTIIIDKAQNFLYVVRPNVVAIRYGIGLGTECTDAQGLYRVMRKEDWPGFHGSPQDRLKNPLGARAIYFDERYRIHGTNVPAQVIGEDDIERGCFFLSNEDVVELSDKTPIETRVVVTE